MTAQQKGFIYTALSAVCFATGGLLIKLNTWSSMSINGMRSFFAFFIFLLYMKLTKHQFKFNWKVLLGVVANSSANALKTIGLHSHALGRAANENAKSLAIRLVLDGVCDFFGIIIVIVLGVKNTRAEVGKSIHMAREPVDD